MTCAKTQGFLAKHKVGVTADEGNDARGRALVQELGIEALAENADWVLLHRDRPVTVPGTK